MYEKVAYECITSVLFNSVSFNTPYTRFEFTESLRHIPTKQVELFDLSLPSLLCFSSLLK